MSSDRSPASRSLVVPTLVAFLMIAGASVIAACGGGSSSSAASGQVVVAAPVTTLVPSGAAVYTRSCARCHGESLQGVGGTPALESWRVTGLGVDGLRRAIASGKGKMPAFGGLTTAQVDALIGYLLNG